MSAPSEAPPALQASTAGPDHPPFDSINFMGPAMEITIGDIRYSYHRFGNAEGGKPALVIINGLGSTQYHWPFMMLEELSGSREVVVFDNALTGLSVDTKQGQRDVKLTVPFMAQSTVDFIAGLNLATPPDVFGLSMGGMVALWIAAHHCGSVRSVVAAATSYGGKAAPQPEGGMPAMLDHLASEKGAADITMLLPLGEKDPDYPILARLFMTLQYAAIPGFMGAPGAGYATAGGIIPPAAEALAVSPEVRRQQADAIREYFEGPGLLPRLASCRKRLLWISGTADPIFPLATATKGAAAVPGSWLVVMEGAGHGLHIPKPVEFAQQVVKFLDASKAEDKQHRKQLEAHAPPGCLGGVWRSLWH